MPGDVVAAPVGAPEEPRIQTVQIGRFQCKDAPGRKPATNAADDRPRIIHVLDDVEHADKVDTALGKTGDIFCTLAKNTAVALAAQALHDALVQFKAVESGARHAQLLQDAQEAPVAAADIQVTLRRFWTATNDLRDLAPVEHLLRLPSDGI